MALCNQEILRGGGERDYHRLRMCVRLHVEQAQRSKNLRIQNEVTDRGKVTKGKKGHNSFTQTEDKRMFFSGKQMGLVRKDSLVVYYMRLPRATASQHKKKWEAQVDLANSMPRETVCSEARIKNKHPLLH